MGTWYELLKSELLTSFQANQTSLTYFWCFEQLIGNELSGNGIGARVTAQQYASDVQTLQHLIEKVYVGSETKPILLGPGGFFDAAWFAEFIGKTTKSLQAITHHVYNLGAGKSVKLTHSKSSDSKYKEPAPNQSPYQSKFSWD